MSSPRYTWRASAEITVTGRWLASATATAVLPTPVGPTRTGVWCLVSGPTKTAFQFFLRQLDHRRAPVHVVRRERRREQADDEPAHFVGVERLSRLDRRAARERGGKALQPILPAAEAPTRQIGDELLQAAGGLETRMRVRRGVYDDAAAGEWLHLVADAREQLAVRFDRIELGGREVERERQQQTLRRRAVARELAHHVLVQHALVG